MIRAFDGIARYARMYWALCRFSLSRTLEFRLDLFFRVLMDLVYYSVTIAFFKVIYSITPNLGGWREDQVLLFISIALIIDGLYMCFISRNIWEIPTLINKGELDYHLVRPAYSLFFPLFKTCEFSSLINTVAGFGYFFYTLGQYQGAVSAANLLLCALLVCIGFVIYVALRLFSVLPVFWTHSTFGFNMLFEALASTMERPEVIFRGISHLILVTVLPFLLISSFPARAVFGDIGALDIAQAVAVLLLMVTAVAFIWERGVRNYSSASS